MRTHLDLFSGIGGFALAARWNGIETIGFCEIEKYAQKVISKHWPKVRLHSDIFTLNGADYAGVWLVTGGFPCQPFSVAGKRRGKEDNRHLWPEMLRVIAEAGPAWVLGENVPGIISMELDNVLSDLENIGYSAWPIVIPACAVDARHRRDRVWIAANAEHDGRRADQPRRQEEGRASTGGNGKAVANVQRAGLEKRQVEPARQECQAAERGGRWLPEPDVGRVAHGVSSRVDRLKGLGNSIVPQVAAEIIRLMILAENEQRLD